MPAPEKLRLTPEEISALLDATAGPQLGQRRALANAVSDAATDQALRWVVEDLERSAGLVGELLCGVEVHLALMNRADAYRRLIGEER